MKPKRKQLLQLIKCIDSIQKIALSYTLPLCEYCRYPGDATNATKVQICFVSGIF